MLLLGLALVAGGCRRTYPNADLLWTGSQLESQLGSADIVLIDSRATGYAAGHIPGAIALHWSACADTASMLLPTAELETLLGAAGISRDSTIVVYDDTLASWGGAGRMFWMFEHLGCTDVHLLDGGWDKWVADGRSTATSTTVLPAAVFTADVQTDLSITTDYLKDRLDDSDFAVIDTRTDEEFNGWTLYGEPRRGHVKGAVQIPYAWNYAADKTVLAYGELKALLDDHGITADKEVVAYCTVGIRSGFQYFLLRLMGFERCANYDGSIVAWGADEDAPMESLPRYDRLVYTGWVQELLSGGTPPTYDNDRYLIVEASWGAADLDWTDEDYAAGHIPGSIHVNTDEFEGQVLPDPTIENPLWFLWPDQYLLPAIAAMGITTDTTVVVYSCTDITAAARLCWVLMYAGVEDVRLYNGKFSKWVADGGAVSSVAEARSPAAAFGATEALHPAYKATTAYVQQHYQDSDVIMADDRSWDEYIGQTSGYSYYDRMGRIPGALWAHWGPNTYDGTDYWDTRDTTLRSWTAIRQMWADENITGDYEVIFYCGSGWRSSIAFLEAWMMGWPRVRNYSDGWMGWSSHPDNNPVEYGRP